MERAVGVAELLDGSLDDRRALIANLRDLRRLNRLTGGARLSVRAIRTLGRIESVLDVGTGAADIPVALIRDAARRGERLRVTATDNRREVLAAAEAAWPTLARVPALVLEEADGRSLPYPDGAFDVAHASMVVHHLDRADGIVFVRELARVARRGIVLNDLVRGRAFWLGAWLLTHTIAPSRFTRHDGPLSVRRAYTATELRELIAAAGLVTERTLVGFAGHRVAIMARRP
jgi:SAM-dependent methyltransferase